jgi:predicted nucleic acid-binding protein
LTSGFVFDTYAWIEYIANSKHAKKVADLLKNARHKKVTPATVIAELTEKLFREGSDRSQIQQIINFIANKTLIVQCDSGVAFRAGEISYTQKMKMRDWGMLDSLNYAVARILNYKFVTGDPHFKGFKDVVWIG